MTTSQKYPHLKALTNNQEFKSFHKKRTENYNIGIKIKQQRLRLSLTQSELADKMGVQQPVIARIENCEGGITSETIDKFCKATGLDIQFIDIEESTSNKSDVFEVVDYILDKGSLILNSNYDISNKKLNKLLFFLEYEFFKKYQAFFLDCHFEAWEHGPVCQEVYHKYKENGYNPIKAPCLMNYNLDSSLKIFIDKYIEKFIYKSAFQLEKDSHKFEPWLVARNNGQAEIIDFE